MRISTLYFECCYKGWGVMPIEQINKAFDLMHKGDAILTVLTFCYVARYASDITIWLNNLIIIIKSSPLLDI